MALPEVLLLLLVNVCAIGVPELFDPPLIVPPCTTVQAYVVPAAVLVRAILGAVPLHIEVAAGVAVTTGIGFTVTTALTVAVHALAVPVTV